MRPVYIGDNPYKGTYKRNNEGDYHMAEYEVNAMIRDKNPDGNDNLILEGVTMAGLLMFGTGLAIRDEFDNVFMDYRDESQKTAEIRWNDRVTYDGTWENNLYTFFTKVTPKLTADLKKPFKLEENQRIDDTPVHKAIREAFVNLIIHSDYLLDAVTLKIIKTADGFEFTNPGILKLPIDEIFKGGNSKPRNPHMQTMLRMVGFGDNAGSGFPTILHVWNGEGWVEPELNEDTRLNQVTLTLKMVESAEKSAEKSANKSAEKSANKSAEKSADLQKRYKQVLDFMQEDIEYTSEEIGNAIALKGSRTRQILNEMVSMGEITALGATKGRKYIKKSSAME